MKLRRAILFVRDLDRMTAFYRDGLGLGLVPAETRPGWAVLDAGGVALCLHAIPPEVAATIVLGDPPRRREETPFKLGFEVPDLLEARERLIAHGAQLDEPTRWGTCDGADPEGNVFQLVVA